MTSIPTNCFFFFFLEGVKDHFLAQKTQFVKDIFLESDTPILAFSSHEIHYLKNGVAAECEKEIMRVLWNVLNFRTRCQRRQAD